jgi:hypothetical protein
MSKLSPVANLVSNKGINVNPMSQKGLLKYAANKDSKTEGKEDSDMSDDDGDYSKFGSKKAKKAAKEAREKELAEMKA